MIFILLFLFAVSLNAQYFKRVDQSYSVPEGKELRIIVNCDAGILYMRRNNESRAVRVYIYYAPELYNTDVHFDERIGELYVDVVKEGLLKGIDSDKTAEIEIEIPYDVPTYLNAKIKAGEVDMDLGDLRLKDFQMASWAGEVTVDFSRPNREIIHNMDIDIKVGSVKLRRLGNANFERAIINGGIGELTVDFSGANTGKAMAKVDLKIGENRVILPRNIGVRLAVSKMWFLSNLDLPPGLRKKGRFYYSDFYEDESRELLLRVEMGIGEIRLDWE